MPEGRTPAVEICSEYAPQRTPNFWRSFTMESGTSGWRVSSAAE